MRWLDEPAPDRVTGQFDAISHPEFGEDVLAVAVHGARTDDEQLGDLLARERLRDQLYDLKLASCQRVRWLLLTGQYVPDQTAHSGGIMERLTTHRRPARLHQVAIRARLQHVAGRSALERLEEVLLASRASRMRCAGSPPMLACARSRLQQHGGLSLPDLIVQLARDPQPLLLLSAQRPPRRRTPSVLKPFEQLIECGAELGHLCR